MWTDYRINAHISESKTQLNAYQQSPEEVRVVGGIDTHNVPLICIVLPSTDHVNAKHTVH